MTHGHLAQPAGIMASSRLDLVLGVVFKVDDVKVSRGMVGRRPGCDLVSPPQKDPIVETGLAAVWYGQ